MYTKTLPALSLAPTACNPIASRNSAHWLPRRRRRSTRGRARGACAGSSSQAGAAHSASRGTSSLRCQCAPSLVLLCFSCGGLSLLLKLALAPLGGLLFLQRLVLHVGDVLRGSLPVGVQDEALVVLCLRKNSRPRIQECRCSGHSF